MPQGAPPAVWMAECPTALGPRAHAKQCACTNWTEGDENEIPGPQNASCAIKECTSVRRHAFAGLILHPKAHPVAWLWAALHRIQSCFGFFIDESPEEGLAAKNCPAQVLPKAGVERGPGPRELQRGTGPLSHGRYTAATAKEEPYGQHKEAD
uniref:Uncharacterized protein n=1 Tax=Eutreptiella gymnastica TaxID=73025 RepID=A0A7S4G5N4_9EUGL